MEVKVRRSGNRMVMRVMKMHAPMRRKRRRKLCLPVLKKVQARPRPCGRTRQGSRACWVINETPSDDFTGAD